jgi:hypothetical protein
LAVKLPERSENGKKTPLAKLTNPPVELVESESEIEAVGERFKRRKIKLEDDDQGLLEDKLKRIINDWYDSRSNLVLKLREWNDLYEGVVTVTDSPWPGACHLHVPLPKIKLREIRSVFMRSTMRPIPFLLTKYAGPQGNYESTKEFTKTLEDFVEDKIKNDTNVHDTLKEAIIPSFRDGTCPIQLTWETDTEMVVDFKTYSKIDDFVVDYPTAKDAGISDEKYSKILHQLGNGDPYDVRYEYEVVNYDGPRAYIVPLIDFVHWPVFIPRIEDLLCFGKRVWYTDYKLQEMVKIGKFDQDDIDSIIASGGEPRSKEAYTQSRDNIEGINRYASAKANEYEFFELVIKASLTEKDREDNIKRKYLAYYHFTSGKILYLTDYPIRKGKPNYFLLRPIRRDGRMLGMSLVDDISDLCEEIDILHRQRINSRTISHVPSFKAKDAAKNRFDPSDKRLRFRPGVVFWLANTDDVQQFDIRPVDLSGSVEEEMMLYQLVDMVTGSTSGNSGALTPLDPRAPARKQQEMLRQSSNRIDDYVESYISVFGSIGSFMVDLYYQYGSDRIKYYTRSEDGLLLQNEMDRAKLYNPNVTFVVNGTSVFESPDQEFQRAVEIDNILAQNPVTAQDPTIRRNSLGRILSASRTQDYKALMPPEQPAEGVTDPGTGLLKNPAEEELKQKEMMQQQKLAAKVGAEDTRHQNKMTQIGAQGEIDAALQTQQIGADLLNQQLGAENGPQGS